MTIPSTPAQAAFTTNHSAAREHVEHGRITTVLRSRGFMAFLVLLGVALRLWSYASNTSLWLDEILLSRSILETPMRELLTEPLQLDQVAPPGFLFVERLAVLVLGKNELALRLFPFLASIAGVILFRRLAERTLDGLAVPFAVAVFAIGFPFIKYASEAKQYGIDATVAIVLLLLALDLRERDASTRRLLVMGVAGLVAVLFSQASVLVMAGIGLALAVEWLIARDRRTLRALLITISMWAAACILAIVAGLRSMTPSTREFMNDFWRSGFLPLPVRSLADLGWFSDRVLSLFTEPVLLRYRWPVLLLVVAIIGTFALWRGRRDVALFLACPLLLALAAAAAHQYPFRSRLLIFLLPGLLLLLASGAEWIRGTAGRLHPALGLGAMLVLLVPPVMALAESPPPYEVEHHRSVLAYLQQQRQPGDVVFVFPLSRIGTLFYGPRYGLQPDDWITSVCDRDETRPYIRDVDRYRGVSRFWLLSSGVRPFRVARASVRQYLGTIGVKRDSLWFPSATQVDVTLELYDLSNSSRLGGANAESFPAPPLPKDPRPGCRGWAKQPEAGGDR